MLETSCQSLNISSTNVVLTETVREQQTQPITTICDPGFMRLGYENLLSYNIRIRTYNVM